MKICIVDGCTNKSFKKGLCGKHYHQIRSYGNIGRTRYDKNEFQIVRSTIYGTFCKIDIYNNFGIKITETIMDVEDIEKCRPYKWYMSQQGYIRTGYGLRLTNIILGVKTNRTTIIDHINGNPLDNRKQNLQVITQQQNQIKKKMQKNNTSGYKGTYWNKTNNKWVSYIGYNRKRLHLGCFASKEEATAVYNKKAKELFDEFAILNKVGGE